MIGNKNYHTLNELIINLIEIINIQITHNICHQIKQHSAIDNLTIFSINQTNKQTRMKGFILKNHLSFYTIFFQIFTISSVTLPNTKKIISFILNLCAILNLLLLSAIIFLAFYYEEEIFYSRDIIGKFTDIIQLLAPIISHMVIICQSLRTKKEQTKIWNKIIISNSLLKSASYRKAELRYSIKFFILNILSILSEIVILRLEKHDLKYTKLWYCKLYSNIVVRLENLQIILYVDILESRLKIINNEMRILTNSSQPTLTKITDKKSYEKIKKIKILHSILWDISQTLNTRFGWSLLFSIINYFVCLTVDFYWIVMAFGICKI